jgi:hypothetical protein
VEDDDMCSDLPDSSDQAGQAEGAPPPETGQARPLSTRRILRTWWPLAGSWFLMGFEGPAVSAVISRLADPKVNLAAHGGLVFPLALIVEAPIIMMLGASTALSRDWPSYLKLRRFMHRMGLALTIIHLLMVATPLYYVIARNIVHAPEQIIGPARLGLLILVPWTWSIAYRRFSQGVIIRFGNSLWVGLGTVVRLAADTLVLAVGFAIGSIPGVAVAAAALSAGVLSEALFAKIAVRKPLARLKRAAPLSRPLTTRAMLDFYIPLSMTSLITQVTAPVGSAALSRMPAALESLAAWPVVNGVNFLMRSFGLGLNETAVALLDYPRSFMRLRRFALVIGILSTIGLVIFLIPAVADLVFGRLLDLAPPLPFLARNSVWFLLPIPALVVLQNLFQGVLLYSGRTRSITESVLLFVVVTTAILFGGVAWGAVTGIYIGIGAFTAGEVIRTFWLWRRSAPARHALLERDSAALSRPAG